MSETDHWHPVLLSRELRRKPVGVKLNGEEIVVFRAGDGRIGALRDVCPHRRMRLSRGIVKNDRLECPYHGWTFDALGAGESPGTPKLHAKAYCYETIERHGAVWLRNHGAATAFPGFNVDGYHPACTLRHRVNAPLEVVLDNFTEIEHTPTTHALLGYALERMPEVTTRVESTDDSVYVFNRGPQKPIPVYAQLMLGVRPGDAFVDEWTTLYSPVHSVYDQWWSNADTGGERINRLRIYVFFNPLSSEETDLLTFAYLKSRLWGKSMIERVIGPLLKRLVDLEIRLDVRMLENLADKSITITGLRLSRFDKVLGLHRRRVATVYRGEPEPILNSPATTGEST